MFYCKCFISNLCMFQILLLINNFGIIKKFMFLNVLRKDERELKSQVNPQRNSKTNYKKKQSELIEEFSKILTSSGKEPNSPGLFRQVSVDLRVPPVINTPTENTKYRPVVSLGSSIATRSVSIDKRKRGRYFIFSEKQLAKVYKDDDNKGDSFEELDNLNYIPKNVRRVSTKKELIQMDPNNEMKIIQELKNSSLLSPIRSDSKREKALSNLKLKKNMPISNTKKFGKVSGYSACTFCNINNINEDKIYISNNIKLVNEQLQAIPSINFYAIFNGYNGNAVSSYLKEALLRYILTDENFLIKTEESILNAVNKVESDVMTELKNIAEKDRNDPLTRAGSCLIFALIIENICYIVSLGDSLALLSENMEEQIYTLNSLHKFGENHEKQRFYKYYTE